VGNNIEKTGVKAVIPVFIDLMNSKLAGKRTHLSESTQQPLSQRISIAFCSSTKIPRLLSNSKDAK
jgi:hypothetical protein